MARRTCGWHESKIVLVPYTNYIERLRESYKVLDFVLVFIIVYAVLKALRRRRAVAQVASFAALVMLYWLALRYDLATLEYVLREVVFYVPILIILLFQFEIKAELLSLGKRIPLPASISFRKRTTLRRHQPVSEHIYNQIVLAAIALASTHTGALIMIERSDSLKAVIDVGVPLDAELSHPLLVSIFQPWSPLHDGAVIVQSQRIAAAACFTSISLNPRISRNLGTRHRAAIGITEDSDTVAVVVSEETGIISFTQGGTISRGFDAAGLRAVILSALKAPSQTPEKI